MSICCTNRIRPSFRSAERHLRLRIGGSREERQSIVQVLDTFDCRAAVRLLKIAMFALRSLPLAALFALAGFHLGVIGFFSVDILHVDEWVVWWGWENTSWVKWLFTRYNEHILVPTKLQIFLTDRFLAGNHLFSVWVSFLTFFAIAIWVVHTTSSRNLFYFFLFCTLPYENHYLPLNVQFHLAILLCFISISILFTPRLSWGRWFLGVGLALLAVISLSAGVAGAFAVGVGYVAYSAKHRSLRSRAILAMGVIGLAVAWWWLGHEWIPQHPIAKFPFHARFWDFFLNVLSSGFGIDRLSTLLGGLCFLVVLTPIVGLLRKKQNWSDARIVHSVAAIGVCFSMVASIAIGRAGAGIGAAKSSRYSEFALFVLPLTAFLYFCWLEKRPEWRKAVLGFLFALCLFTFSNNWDFSVYRRIHIQLSEGRQCAQHGLSSVGPIDCPGLFPGDLRPWLDRAKRMHSGQFERLSR